MERRRLGNSDIEVVPVAMGCWPMTGITNPRADPKDAEAALAAAFEAGVNCFDSAYAYGYEGEADRMIARVLGPVRKQIVLATKVGIYWENRVRKIDGRPEILRQQCMHGLERLGVDQVDLLYLHAPDPAVPIAESANALRELLDEGKTRSVGVSNVTVEQIAEFARCCPVTACQPPYNMLQRDIEADLLPWCRQRNIAVLVYWPLMKGLLAGSLQRDHQFADNDGRSKYPMFQGAEWQKNQDFLDQLRAIARDAEISVPQLVVRWTIEQPGITAALCGARIPAQIQEVARAATMKLDETTHARITQALAERGQAITRSAV